MSCFRNREVADTNRCYVSNAPIGKKLPFHKYVLAILVLVGYPRSVHSLITIRRATSYWDGCPTDGTKEPHQISWNMTLSPLAITAADPACPVAPSQPSPSICVLQPGEQDPTLQENSNYTTTTSYRYEECSSYPGPSANLVGSTFPSPLLFPPSAKGYYLFYTDAVVGGIGPLQPIFEKNNNVLGQVCLAPPPGRPPGAPPGPPPPIVGGALPDVRMVQALLADGVCRRRSRSNSSVAEYWQASCTNIPGSITATLKYGCIDQSCTSCSLLPLSGCGFACVNVTEYSNTPLFDWGSPLLNGVRPVDKIPVEAHVRSVSVTTSTSTQTVLGDAVKEQVADQSFVMVAIAVAGSVMLLACGVLVFAFIFIRKRRKLILERERLRHSSFNMESAGSANINSLGSHGSTSDSTAKALAIARRQYRNALKEARREEKKRLHQRKQDSTASSLNMQSYASSPVESAALSEHTIENRSSNSHLIPTVKHHSRKPSKAVESRETEQSNSLAFSSVFLESDENLSVIPSVANSSPDLSSQHTPKFESTDPFFQSAILAAAQAANAAQHAAMYAQTAAFNAANAVVAATKATQNAQLKHEKSERNKQDIELNALQLPATEVSDVIVPASDYANPEFAKWGTPESQYSFLSESPPPHLLRPTTSPGMTDYLESIPPIILTETTVTTKTTTISHRPSKNHRKIGYPGSSKPLITHKKMDDKEQAVCILPHTAGRSHEIDMEVGDKVKIIKRDADWIVGVNSRTGSEGAFPSNCIRFENSSVG